MALLYKEVKDLIFKEIIQMEPHTKVPSRAQLCERFMVTRTTVDRAISELISEEHLYSVNGSGTFVSDPSAGHSQLKRNVLNIGVLLPNIMHDTYPGIVRGIEDVAESNNMNMVICNTDNDAEKQYSYIQRLINSKISGVIIIPAISKVPRLELYAMLREAEIPFVFCNRSDGDASNPLICSNDFHGGYLATSHLLEKGYRKIAYIAGMLYKSSADRLQGYLSALWQQGIPVDEDIILFSEKQTFECGRVLTDTILEQHPDVDALFCFNDQMASGAVQAVQARGLTVSDDIGIIGYDNTKACEMFSVALTSMSYRNYEMGSAAARIILELIADPCARVKPMTSFCPQLVVRSSCLGKRP